MDDYLTTQQVQALLQVDRTTIYRMLKDGRLSGVKVGRQWRFQRHDVDRLLGAPQPPPAAANTPVEILPISCVQAVQDVCAEIGDVGAVTTTANGVPLTRVSNCCQFCALILGSEIGQQACSQSWQQLAAEPDDTQTRFMTCHAGLQYARACIQMHNHHSAMLIAGQFYANPPDHPRRDPEIRALAAAYGLDADQLVEASHQIVYLGERKRSEITRWLKKVAGAFAQISRERADLIGRLAQIAVMTKI